MITDCGIRHLKKYCIEPIENIKGYREAVESEGRYDCHHINELTFTKDELIKMNMYYHRPASELIIMTHAEHKAWHHRCNGHPMTGLTGDKCQSWKGDNVGASAMYNRAKKLYKAGKISEVEFQPFRDMWIEYKKMRKLK